MDINKWKEEWMALDAAEERTAFEGRFRNAIKQIPEEDLAGVQREFLQMAKSDLAEAERLMEVVNLRKKLEPVLKFISLSEIAKVYFGKSRHWLYHRLNNTVINGTPAQFTDKDVETLKTALSDLSDKMKQAVQLI
ncbi:DUF5053 domain-containing protein [Parabacteroides sp. OttesenSCG-928-O15]|nr:DUF5053 domain-containing protein [Parabacteroides sp. OttesenSCG-928-O15]